MNRCEDCIYCAGKYFEDLAVCTLTGKRAEYTDEACGYFSESVQMKMEG